MGRVMVWAMKRRGVDGEDGEVGWRGVSSWRTRKTGREKEKEERERDKDKGRGRRNVEGEGKEKSKSKGGRGSFQKDARRPKSTISFALTEKGEEFASMAREKREADSNR